MRLASRIRRTFLPISLKAERGTDSLLSPESIYVCSL